MVISDEQVEEKFSVQPFELKFRTPEKKPSTDIYNLYLEDSLPLVMPKPYDGIEEVDLYFKKIGANTAIS